MAKVTNNPPDDEADFASLMPGVRRLDDDRINVYQYRPDKPLVKPKTIDRDTPDFSELNFQQMQQIRDSHFDHGIQRKLQKKIRQGQLAVEGCLDLHGCTQKIALSELSLFLSEAISVGHKLVIIIHGKGQRSQNSAVLKPLVLHWISQQNTVLAWCPAQPRDGGSGASYVYLR